MNTGRRARGDAVGAAVTGASAPAPGTPLAESWRDFGAQVYAQGALQAGELTLAELREAALQLAV